MKIGRCLLAACVVALICQVAFGQVTLAPHHAPFMTSSQFIAITETEAAASSIVSQALAEHVRVFPNKSTTVAGAQVPDNWLPAIPTVRFQTVTDEAVRSHLQRCGRLLFINSFSLPTSDQAAVTVAEGTQCAASGIDLRFRRSEDGWHLERDGVLGGFGSGTSGCGCR